PAAPTEPSTARGPPRSRGEEIRWIRRLPPDPPLRRANGDASDRPTGCRPRAAPTVNPAAAPDRRGRSRYGLSFQRAEALFGAHRDGRRARLCGTRPTAIDPSAANRTPNHLPFDAGDSPSSQEGREPHPQDASDQESEKNENQDDSNPEHRASLCEDS